MDKKRTFENFDDYFEEVFEKIKSLNMKNRLIKRSEKTEDWILECMEKNINI